MSDRSLRRRHPPSTTRKIRLPHPSSSSPTTRTPDSARKPAKRSSKPTKFLKRCVSEPMLWIGASENEDQRPQRISSDYEEAAARVLYRPHTCLDVFSSSPALNISFSPRRSSEGYNKDAKVVVNVTVEGSPGPVRAMVKLGSSVEDTIKVVVDKYGEEGRTPKLDKHATSSYELHESHFSLQSLDKSELIGDVGSRSFYLRKSGSNQSSNAASPSLSEIAPETTTNTPQPPNPPPTFLLPALISRKIGKIVRRTRRLWKVLICWN